MLYFPKSMTELYGNSWANGLSQVPPHARCPSHRRQPVASPPGAALLAACRLCSPLLRAAGTATSPTTLIHYNNAHRQKQQTTITVCLRPRLHQLERRRLPRRQHAPRARDGARRARRARARRRLGRRRRAGHGAPCARVGRAPRGRPLSHTLARADGDTPTTRNNTLNTTLANTLPPCTHTHTRSCASCSTTSTATSCRRSTAA